MEIDIDRRREKWGHACNPRGNRSKIVGIRVISRQIIARPGTRTGVVLEQSRQYAYNLKCFKMEIKRRLRAFCKATRRALEYIIEQCQHLFLITFRRWTRPRKFLARILSFIRCWNIESSFIPSKILYILFFFFFLIQRVFDSSSEKIRRVTRTLRVRANCTRR